MTQYQKLLKSTPRSKGRFDRRSEIQAAVSRLSSQMGEVVIASRKRAKCQQSSLWVLLGRTSFPSQEKPAGAGQRAAAAFRRELRVSHPLRWLLAVLFCFGTVPKCRRLPAR